MRIVLTGGAGFIGSHLSEALLGRGHQVVAVDNFLTGDKRNLEGLQTRDGFTFLEHDCTEPLGLDGPVDAICHFASPASPVDYTELPLETLEVGSRGTLLTLKLAREKGARYLLASTSEVYGDPTVHPQTESYFGNVNPNGPRSMYDEAKRFAEAAVMVYHRDFQLDTRIVRIFNTYGPRMRIRDGRAVPNFICQALKNEDITLYGDGTQTRSFCYVSDLTAGIVRLVEHDRDEAIHAPINIGNPTELTIRQLAEEIKRLTGSESRIISARPLPENDPLQRQPDIGRARAQLDWQPTRPLAEGLPPTIDDFRARLVRHGGRGKA